MNRRGWQDYSQSRDAFSADSVGRRRRVRADEKRGPVAAISAPIPFPEARSRFSRHHESGATAPLFRARSVATGRNRRRAATCIIDRAGACAAVPHAVFKSS